MLLIRFENIFVIALCIMEGPAAVLAPVELALVVDGIAGKGKRRLVRIWGRQRCCVLVVVQIRFSFCTLSYCLRLKKTRQIYKIPFISASKKAKNCNFCQF